MQQWQRTLLSFSWSEECSAPVRIRFQACCGIRSGFHFVSGTTVSKKGFCSLFLLIILCPTRKQYPENIQNSMQVVPFKTWHNVKTNATRYQQWQTLLAASIGYTQPYSYQTVCWSPWVSGDPGVLLELLPLMGSSIAPQLPSGNLPWHLVSRRLPWPCPREAFPSVLLETALTEATAATSPVREAGLGLTLEGVCGVGE